MFPVHYKAHSLLYTMLVTGIILVPTAIATPAVQDLVDLRNVINAAASAIGDPNNPNRGFGFNLFGGSGNMGTADLVNNITTTILRGKFQLDTNRVPCPFPQISSGFHTDINNRHLGSSQITSPTPPSRSTAPRRPHSQHPHCP
jgi:Tfp pilus assembly major pilin PilA